MVNVHSLGYGALLTTLSQILPRYGKIVRPKVLCYLDQDLAG